ncbi:ABC transporter substrate-binding protein [Seohaeicola zhoushanensis]
MASTPARAGRIWKRGWAIRPWPNGSRSKAATGEDYPGTGALLGRSGAGIMVAALEAAGPDLTRENFIKAMESLDYEDPISGNRVDFSAEDHVGADEVFVSRIENGHWVLVQTIK